MTLLMGLSPALEQSVNVVWHNIRSILEVCWTLCAVTNNGRLFIIL